jgi:uncharacterized membrane protein (DUF106 family)
MEDCNRRKSDSLLAKLTKLSSIIIALGILLGALSLIASTVFVKSETVEKLDERVKIVETLQTTVSAKIDAVQTTQKEMQKDIREIRNAILK